MGAIISLLETLLVGESDWILTGLQKGYFPLRKHWTLHDVQHAQQLFTQAATVRVSNLSLVGQTFEDGSLEELLKLLVERQELEILRLAGEISEMDDLLQIVVAKHRPHGYPKLRVEHCLEHSPDGYWHELTRLPSMNKLVLETTS